MEELTYRRYLTDPRVRERIEREVRRVRAEAVRRYIVAPLHALLRRRRSKSTHRLAVRSA